MHSSEFADLTEEHFDTTLKTNLYGYFHMSHLDWPEVRATEALESLTHHRLVRPEGDLRYPLLVA